MHYYRSLAVAAVLMLGTSSLGLADDATVPTNPGFNPDTGQINAGTAWQAPTQSDEGRTIPTPEQSRAALLAPVSTQPSLGNGAVPEIPRAEAPTRQSDRVQKESKNAAGGPQGSGANANHPQFGQQALGEKAAPVTTGTGQGTGNGQIAGAAPNMSSDAGRADEPSPSGPIGAVGETMPAKFSLRNDILDRTPIMAFPSRLDDQARRKIFDAVMADKAAPTANAESLTMASQLSTDQALDGMHPLPESLNGIVGIQKYKYVKAKDKVMLVQPATRIVVEVIKG